ncbi:MAG: stage III sporulation protein AA [Firmicutes bacterium]|nr:stage III sporulation protein AA [Bacillota bacterium]
MTDWLRYLAAGLREPVGTAAGLLLPGPEEIRLRAGRPVELIGPGRSGFVTPAGELTEEPGRALRATPSDVATTFQLVCQGSVYAWEEELRGGFVTLPGGHRVGVAGRAVVEGGRLRTVRPVASLSLRIARALPGAARGLLPHLVTGGRLLSTLLISPPQAGKTTLLRDLVRLASTGDPAAGLRPQKVAVVDERSEIGGSAGGVPTLDLGPRTDVLDGCPKAEGMLLVIRALSPEVVAVDELGRDEDAGAVLEGLLAGVTVLATAHAGSLDEARRRPSLRRLLAQGAFARAVLLSRRLGPGTVEQVWRLPEGEPLLRGTLAPRDRRGSRQEGWACGPR